MLRLGDLRTSEEDDAHSKGARTCVRAPPSRHVRQSLELANVGGLKLAVLAGGDVKLDGLALVQRLEAVHLDLGIVNEQVVPILTEMKP